MIADRGESAGPWHTLAWGASDVASPSTHVAAVVAHVVAKAKELHGAMLRRRIKPLGNGLAWQTACRGCGGDSSARW